TSLANSHGQVDIAKRADAYGMPGVAVDGQDVQAVYEATRQAVARARAGEGPTLIEARTYRFDEHQVGLICPGEPYRSVAEVEYHKANRDPLVLFRQLLVADGFAESELNSIEHEVSAAVDAAVEFAESSASPDLSTLYDYLYSDPIDV